MEIIGFVIFALYHYLYKQNVSVLFNEVVCSTIIYFGIFKQSITTHCWNEKVIHPLLPKLCILRLLPKENWLLNFHLNIIIAQKNHVNLQSTTSLPSICQNDTTCSDNDTRITEICGTQLTSPYNTRVPAEGKSVIRSELKIKPPEGWHGRIPPLTDLATFQHISIG